jgi:hypothetical protein
MLEITGLATMFSVGMIFGLNNCEYAGIRPTGSAIIRQHGDYELHLLPVILLGSMIRNRSNHFATNGSCYTNVTDELTQDSQLSPLREGQIPLISSAETPTRPRP